MKQPAVYIMTSQRNDTLYVGVTSDLVKRVWEHRNNVVEGFTNRYAVHWLVYYELHQDMLAAITREKCPDAFYVTFSGTAVKDYLRNAERFMTQIAPQLH